MEGLSPGAQKAFEDLSQRVEDLSLDRERDREAALGLFMALLDRGEPLDPAAVEAWFVEYGWDPATAAALARMPGDIAYVRGGEPRWAASRVDWWFK
jgi:hypothetical protein